MNFFKKIFFFIILIIPSVLSQTIRVIPLETRTESMPFNLSEKVPTYLPKVAVALSGGGARGLAQIGVLKAFEKAGIPIDIIVGTSMGSVVGGLFSAGYTLSQIDSIAENADWDALLSSTTNRRDLFVDQKITEDKAVFTLRLRGLKPVIPTSINNGQSLSNFLNILALQAPIHVKKNFDDLEYNFRAVCTDLVTGSPVILDKGSLSQAMRASSSVSFLLAPVKIDSLILVDGGLVANVPVKISSQVGGDFVIAVNTTSPLNNLKSLEYPWVVADQIVSIPMKLLNQEQIHDADFSINPLINDDKSAGDFTEIHSIVQKGFDYASAYTGAIKAKIDSMYYEILSKNKKEFFIKNILNDNKLSHLGTLFYREYSLNDSVSNYDIINFMSDVYKSGNYKKIRAVIKDFGNKSIVDFISEENPEIKNVNISGINLFDENKIDSIFSSLINQPFNSKKLLSKIIDVLKLYRNKEYSLADLDSLYFDKANGLLKLFFNEGIISSIIIEGNKQTNNTVIERELPFKAGDYFLSGKATEALINLQSTNLFDDINLSVERREDKNILVIRVLEKASSLLRVGFRVDNENKAQLRLDLRDENLFGTGTELGLLLSGGSRSRAYILEQKANRIFDTYLTYNINAFYKFDDVFTYKNDSSKTDKTFSRSVNGEYRQIYYGGSLAIGTQVGRFGNLIFKGTYKIDKIKNKQNSPVNPLKTKIISLKISSTIDTQNKYPYPTKGFYFTGFYETAQKALGGEIGYTNISFEYESYIPLGDRSIISPKIMMGFADRTLPITEQYSLGGQDMFFGMRKDEFRGRQIFLTSLSYRYKLPVKIFFDSYLDFRYDLGSTWPTQEQIRFKDLRHGIGAAISFDTPIGPADFSVGKSFLFKKNLPNNPVSWGETLFYFSIGYPF